MGDDLLMSKVLSHEEAEIVIALNRLAKYWPDHLMLFSSSGSLLLVDRFNKQILADIPGIHNDGGDPGATNEDGKEYLDLP
jgi:hypothetical protein